MVGEAQFFVGKNLALTKDLIPRYTLRVEQARVYHAANKRFEFFDNRLERSCVNFLLDCTLAV